MKRPWYGWPADMTFCGFVFFPRIFGDFEAIRDVVMVDLSILTSMLRVEIVTGLLLLHGNELIPFFLCSCSLLQTLLSK